MQDGVVFKSVVGAKLVISYAYRGLIVAETKKSKSLPSSSRLTTVHEARVQTTCANRMLSTNPGNESFESKSITSMR